MRRGRTTEERGRVCKGRKAAKKELCNQGFNMRTIRGTCGLGIAVSRRKRRNKGSAKATFEWREREGERKRGREGESALRTFSWDISVQRRWI